MKIAYLIPQVDTQDLFKYGLDYAAVGNTEEEALTKLEKEFILVAEGDPEMVKIQKEIWEKAERGEECDYKLFVRNL